MIWTIPDSCLKGTSVFLTNAYDSMYDGYFSSSNQPLLHLWSISLEIQFYMAYAIFALIFMKFIGRYFISSIFILSVVSLIACQAIIDIRPHWDFYLLPFRGWEFGVGAIVSRAPSRDQSRKLYGNIISLFGILLVLCPFFLYDSTFGISRSKCHSILRRRGIVDIRKRLKFIYYENFEICNTRFCR